MRLNIKESVEIKLELYKNRHEKIAEIPLDYVENIRYKFNDIDEIAITIPQYIGDKGHRIFNHLYRKINSRQIVIVTTKNKNGNVKQQKFTLANKKSVGSFNKGSKSFVAYSWEKTIERDRITIDALSRQLTNKDDNVHVGEGVLDYICKKIGWKVGYVDPKARTKVSLTVETFSQPMFSNLELSKVTNGMLLFDRDVTITVPDEKPLYLTFHYTNPKVYDINNNLLISMNNIENNLNEDPLYTSVKNIKAYHYSEAGNRYGIRYVITMVDNVQVERVCTFTNCIDKKLTIDTINLSYDFGDIVEKENIQFANFEAFDDSALKYLNDIQNVFECVFKYDTMTNTINVYGFESLNVNSGYPLTLGENVIEINTSEDESIPTMLKVDSENTSIIEYNPNGTQFIENYDYYIKNGLISDSLKNALKEYDRISISLMEQWNVLNRSKTLLRQKYTKADSEVKSLTERIKGLMALLSSLFNADANRQLEVKQEIEQLEARMAVLLGQMSGCKTEMDTLDEQIATINSKSQKENMVNEQGVKVFSESDLLEIGDMREIIQISDNYYTTGYGLYEYAKRYLADKANPKIDFDLNCVDLTKVIQNPRGWNNVLTLGTLFPVEENDTLSEKEIRLTEMELIPVKGTDSVKANSFKFSNKILKSVSVGSNIGKSVNKFVGKISDFNDVWNDSKYSNNFVSEMRKNGLNLASANINAKSMRNKLDFSEAGMFVIDATNEDNQLYMGSSIIAFSNDKFKTCKTALDQNGLIASVLIGEIILGNKLVIQSDDGLFYVGNDEGTKNFGINIYDSLNEGRQKRIFLGLEETNGVKKAVLRLMGKNGQVAITENGIVNNNQLIFADNVSLGYPLNIPLFVDSGVFEVRKCKLMFKIGKYRSYERSLSAGGSVQTSSNGGATTSSGGGGGTSSSNGGHSHTMFRDVGDIQAQFYDTCLQLANGGLLLVKASQAPGAGSYTSMDIGSHSHTTDVHTHTIGNHTHTLNTEHNHSILRGIYESDETPTNIQVRVNDVLVYNVYNNTSDVNIDIGQYLKIGQYNNISIACDKNSRISGNLFLKSFIGY